VLNCVSSCKSADKLFHTQGPVTEKVLSSKVLCVRGTKHDCCVYSNKVLTVICSYKMRQKYIPVCVKMKPEIQTLTKLFVSCYCFEFLTKMTYDVSSGT